MFSHEDLVVTGLRSYFNTFAKSDKWHIFFFLNEFKVQKIWN